MAKVASRWTPCAVVLLTSTLSVPALAQQADARRYLTDRADEDWSFLKDTPHTDVWDPVKYMPFGNGERFVTLSGEVRYRPEGFRIRSTNTVDNYLLQRYLFGADIHLGARTRAFAEVQSGVINGSLRSPRPTDRDSLDLHQGFFEWRQSAGNGYTLSVKAGRQELSVGSSRLISASPGLNVKRSFDGVATSFRAPSWTIAGAVARLVALNQGVFDDGSDPDQLFWGVAAGRRSPWFQGGEFGAYYLGIDRSLSRYVQGMGAERRHTFGMKWTVTGSRIDWNYDALFQSGDFDGAPIRGWAFATETGYRVTIRRWLMRASARADIASGDRDPANPRLEAFNPLFAGNSYSGAVGLFGPTNLTDFTPGVTMRPRSYLTIGFEAPSYWRTSEADGIYATDLRVLLPPAAGRGKYVGTNPGVFVNWQATRHWQIQGAITRFLAGAFLEQTFVASGFGFYSTTATYRF